MGRRYEHFSISERVEIARLLGVGTSLRQIATALCRSASSICREIERNGGQSGYLAEYAAQQAMARWWRGSRLDRNADLRNTVLDHLARGWSPEQVVGWFRHQGPSPIGVESIYRFIHAQIRRTKDYGWRHLLPRGKARRGIRPKPGGSSTRLIRERVSITLRPEAAQSRQSPGHWEADLMAFSRYGQNLLVLHERMSRVLVAVVLPSKHAEPVARAIKAALAPLPAPMRQTITFDNGTEFARHALLHRKGIATFFCDPHAPWQKGGIENAIGRMRRSLPRKTDLAKLDPKQLRRALLVYNTTPRKCLDWNTPAQAFYQHMLHFKRESTPPLSRG
ncbi:IS30 family transposase [Devosia riboflavina]|uniref:IS30 family transposase n=1 Tax=Devosia riboflavina TaxID=46914 RepID=UPI00068BE4DF|nr:IS30 family transposase [Devosia riboflavina]